MSVKKIWSSTSMLTKIVAVLVVGFFAYINVIEYGPFVEQTSGELSDGEMFEYWHTNVYGWPLHYEQTEVVRVSRGCCGIDNINIPPGETVISSYNKLSWVWMIPPVIPLLGKELPIFINILVALICTALISLFCEWLVRYRRQRQGLEQTPLDIGMYLKKSVRNIFDNKKIFFASLTLLLLGFNLPFLLTNEWLIMWLIYCFPASFLTRDYIGDINTLRYEVVIPISIIYAIIYGYILTNLILIRRARLRKKAQQNAQPIDQD